MGGDMERGLLWLPLLALFIGLAWAGWNEYQKVEAYRHWAEPFDRAKYDIYAALGQSGAQLTWGKPTRAGVLETQTLSLQDVDTVVLKVGDRTLSITDLTPDTLDTLRGNADLEFHGKASYLPISVPFTDAALAAQWAIVLDRDLSSAQFPSQA